MTREEVFQKAFVEAIKAVGMENFKKCSFFMRNFEKTIDKGNYNE